ncbi:aspartate-semialdehyde dehydrogenase [Myxococcota bacterium]|nr:aspartate-semialdehyde dehydrogenase [Myxococcota bacterium]
MSSQKKYTVAVVGATGLVGREILNILAERQFPVKEVRAFATMNSAGQDIDFGDSHIRVNLIAHDSFDGVDIVLMSAGGKASKAIAKKAVAAGAIVIDNSSAWRDDKDVPLIVPEVNPEALADYKKKGIVANPNCSTIQMMVALAPLHKEAGLKRVIVSTYQSVSGAGKQAMDELNNQISKLYNQREFKPEVFTKQIAFNVIPHIDSFQEDGATREEAKMLYESRKILGLPELGVIATCVRVPVFVGHAEAIVAEFEKEIPLDKARAILRESPGIFMMDEPKESLYPTPQDSNSSDATFIGRLRVDPSAPNSLAMWVVADNLRKGAATNAVQIAEMLTRDYLG